jgi:hypothetical protein
MPDQRRRAPDWAWDEIVLACDLVARNDWQQLLAEGPQVIGLSRHTRPPWPTPDELRELVRRQADGGKGS